MFFQSGYKQQFLLINIPLSTSWSTKRNSLIKIILRIGCSFCEFKKPPSSINRILQIWKSVLTTTWNINRLCVSKRISNDSTLIYLVLSNYNTHSLIYFLIQKEQQLGKQKTTNFQRHVNSNVTCQLQQPSSNSHNIRNIQ